MELPKIHLSDAEEKLMLDASVILTKNRIMQEMKTMLESVEAVQYEFTMHDSLRDRYPFNVPAKISRGENYQGLPWMILDFPRKSSAEGHFFIRLLFWWGKFFSTTLHLSGKEKEKYLERISNSRDLLHDHYIGINVDPWQHDFGSGNYRKIGDLEKEAFQLLCAKGSHLKIACALPLERWQTAREELFGQWKMLLKICGSIT